MATYRYVVDLEWNGTGSPGVNVWHLRTADEGPLNNDLEQCVDAIKDFYDALSSIFPTGMKITGPTEAIKDPAGDPSYEAVTGWSVTGDSGSSSYLPPATTVVVGWRTTSATRSGRGRTFLGPLAVPMSDATGSPTPALLTALNGAAAALVAFNDGFENGAIGVYSTTQNIFRDITGARVRDQFAVLRSRRD